MSAGLAAELSGRAQAKAGKGEDGGVMKILRRSLGVTASAVAGHLVLVLAAGGTGQDDANIGAGLIVFAILVAMSFGWALVDGYREKTPMGGLLARWGVVAVVVPVLITVALWAVNRTAPDWSGRPEMFVLWLLLAAMSFVPAVIGVALGNASRGASGPASLRSS